MNPNSTHTELLNQYLDRELDPSATKDLELQLSQDIKLKEELDRLVLARDGIKLFGLREQVKSIRKELRPQSEIKRTGVVRNISRWTLRIAAVLLLVIAGLGIYEYTSLSSDKLFNQQYEPFEIRTDRGAEGKGAVELEYAGKNYSSAIASFHSSSHHGPADNFFVAQAYLHEHKSAEAIKYFELALISSDTTHLYKEETEYYLALAYLQGHQVNKAIPLFEKIHADPNHPFHDKVSDWFLRRLSWLKKK